MGFQYGTGRDVATGCATLKADGISTRDGVSGLRQLAFDLHLVGFLNLRVTPHNLNRFPMIPSVYFEVRPDLPVSLVGKDVWARWQEMYNSGPLQIIEHPLEAPCSLPPYREAGTFNRSYNVLGNTTLLSTLRISLKHRCFKWGSSIPELFIGLSDRLPPDICCLGIDFLQHGLVAWDDGYTFFFPPEVKQDTWASLNHFSTVNPTVIS